MIIPVITALTPVFLIILLGYVFKRLQFPGDAFWPLMEKVTYFVLFPALLIDNLISASPLQNLTVLSMGLALLSTVLLMSGLLIISQPWLPVSGPTFTSIFQGAIRFNGYIGIAIALALHGAPGVTLSALAIAAMVPVINVLCVTVLAHYASHERMRWQAILQALTRNPLILGCLTGIILNLTQIPIPHALRETTDILGRAALPFGLLAIGAGLQFRLVSEDHWGLLISSAVKLLIFPILVKLFCQFWQLDPQTTHVAVIFAAVPTASSGYILARQMGGNASLMANIITAQTLLAMLTLPIALTL